MKHIAIASLLLLNLFSLKAQIVINEASNKNFTQISDEYGGENLDWIELFNTSSSVVNLEGWGISDSRNKTAKWVLPNYTMKPNSYLVVFASGLNLKKVDVIDHWELATMMGDTFNYLEPTQTVNNWNSLTFDATSWKKGPAGFGYGSESNLTVTNKTSPVVYIRKTINIPDTAAISTMELYAAYDDGFVAYFNGIEIARACIDSIPSWNTLASFEHNYANTPGMALERFEIKMDSIRSYLKPGANIFSIEVHNRTVTSPSLTIVPYLAIGIKNKNTFFSPLPTGAIIPTSISLHTNFKIAGNGEKIFLSNPDSLFVDSIDVDHLPLNASIGRVKDGADTLGIFLKATPGASNDTSKAYTNGHEPAPQISDTAGFYRTTIKVTLTDSSTTGTLRYTLDGSEPTEKSTLYNGTPISITTTKTLKAKCFSTSDKLPSKTKTATYFINKTHVLPVISITTDNANLYGSTGIFDNYDFDWNKPCYIEYFDDKQQLQFKQDAGVQIDGGAGGSRSQPQHSVRIEPGNSTFGDGDVDYKLIPDRPNRNKYSSFYLRNGSNQYNTLQYKDGFQVKAIAKNTYAYYSAYTPIVVYINGSYSGLYELREKLNADYLKENYLMDIDTLDLLTLSYYKGRRLEALEGSTAPFWADVKKFNTLSPSSDDYLERISKFLDLNNYTDYIVAQSWICNTDWPNNNIRVFRCKSTDYKWQYAVQDVEWAMSPNGWSTSTLDHIAYMLKQSPEVPHIAFWQSLIKNNDYKTTFINRFADLMNTNYLFSTLAPMEEEMYLLQYPEMTDEFAKWKNSTITAFKNNHLALRSQIEIRSANVRKHLQKNFNLNSQIAVTLDVKPAGAGQIKISTVTPGYYPWSGIYFSNIPVKITATANPGYTFVGWENNPLISDINNPELTLTMADTIEQFTANFEVVETTFKGITISEIHYKNGNESSTDWVELWNTSDTKIDLNGWYITDRDSANKFIFKDNVSIEPNSRLVIARDTAIFNQRYAYSINYTGPLGFKLSSPIDEIKLFDNNDSLRVLVIYSDFYPWPLNGDDNGRTLELKDPAGDLTSANSWFAGCVGGSPGSAFKACPVPVFTGINQSEVASASAYPVPASDFVNIKINLKKASKNCELKVYNMYGSEVNTIKLGNLASGNYNNTINLSNLPTGLLFVKFQSDNTIENLKIIHAR